MTRRYRVAMFEQTTKPLTGATVRVARDAATGRVLVTVGARSLELTPDEAKDLAYALRVLWTEPELEHCEVRR